MTDGDKVLHIILPHRNVTSQCHNFPLGVELIRTVHVQSYRLIITRHNNDMP